MGNDPCRSNAIKIRPQLQAWLCFPSVPSQEKWESNFYHFHKKLLPHLLSSVWQWRDKSVVCVVKKKNARRPRWRGSPVGTLPFLFRMPHFNPSLTRTSSLVYISWPLRRPGDHLVASTVHWRLLWTFEKKKKSESYSVCSAAVMFCSVNHRY